MIHFECHMTEDVAKSFGLEVIERRFWKRGYTKKDMVFFHSTNFSLQRGIESSVLDPRYAKEFVLDSDGNHIGMLLWAFADGANAARGFGEKTTCKYYFKVPAGTEFFATKAVADTGDPKNSEVGFPYIIENEDIIWNRCTVFHDKPS